MPTNALLLRHGVKCDAARVLFTQESVAAGVALTLCLRELMPKVLIRWLVQRFVLAEMSTLRLVFVPSEKDPFWFEMPARATCGDLARHIYKERWCSSMPLDTFWVHVKGSKLELCAMGLRVNGCIATKWGHFSEWTEDALTEEEVHWLNERTLLEAGFQTGSNIDVRYAYSFENVLRAAVLSPAYWPPS